MLAQVCCFIIINNDSIKFQISSSWASGESGKTYGNINFNDGIVCASQLATETPSSMSYMNRNVPPMTSQVPYMQPREQYTNQLLSQGFLQKKTRKTNPEIIRHGTSPEHGGGRK